MLCLLTVSTFSPLSQCCMYLLPCAVFITALLYLSSVHTAPLWTYPTNNSRFRLRLTHHRILLLANKRRPPHCIHSVLTSSLTCPYHLHLIRFPFFLSPSIYSPPQTPLTLVSYNSALLPVGSKQLLSTDTVAGNPPEFCSSRSH